MEGYHFFAVMSRMKYINRWSLMNNMRTENISEHSLTVAMIAHALCIIGNRQCGKKLDPDRAATVALFHDCTEILTGDLPTPIKYSSKTLRNAYSELEQEAAERLVSSLPVYMQDVYKKLLCPENEDEYMMKLIKAADKLSALIKCIEEQQVGNNEFTKAKLEITKFLTDNALPEVTIFMRDFLPSYYLSLDEQDI